MQKKLPEILKVILVPNFYPTIAHPKRNVGSWNLNTLYFQVNRFWWRTSFWLQKMYSAKNVVLEFLTFWPKKWKNWTFWRSKNRCRPLIWTKQEHRMMKTNTANTMECISGRGNFKNHKNKLCGKYDRFLAKKCHFETVKSHWKQRQNEFNRKHRVDTYMYNVPVCSRCGLRRLACREAAFGIENGRNFDVNRIQTAECCLPTINLNM